MIEDKFLMLQMHGCSDGLSDETVREIADACEVLKVDAGEHVHHANQPFESIYLVIYGRVRQSLIDIQGRVMLQRYQTAGGQIGALAAALAEPSPIDVVAEEPTTLLRLDYRKAMELTREHELFRLNFTRIVADSMRTLLMKDRRQKKPVLVALIHQSPASRPLTRVLIERLIELGERPCLFSDRTDWQPIDSVPFRCVIEDGKLLEKEDLRQQLNQWSDSKRIFFDIDASIDQDRVLRLVEFSEKVFWCVTPDNWKEAVAGIAEMEKHAPGWRDKINVIWLLNDGRAWAPFAPELRRLAKRDFKISFDEPPANRSRELLNGVERVVHQLRGVRIGLALGGGAARGMAHLGVLKALEQNGIVVDMIAGTSAGAMTGILYASGMEADYNVDCFVRDLTPSWLFRRLPRGGYWYLLSKYRRRKFDPMLRKYLQESRLEQLPISVHSITVDLVSGEPVVRDEGDAVHAITESINLPGLASPINRDGRALVDGGIVNNVPANVLVSKGCNFVLAVSVTAQMDQQFATNRPDTPTSKMRTASTLQTILRTYLVQNVNMNSVGVEPADFVIAPDVTGFDITEFTRADEMAAIGERTALESLPQLKSMLSKVDKELFQTE